MPVLIEWLSPMVLLFLVFGVQRLPFLLPTNCVLWWFPLHWVPWAWAMTASQWNGSHWPLWASCNSWVQGNLLCQFLAEGVICLFTSHVCEFWLHFCWWVRSGAWFSYIILTTHGLLGATMSLGWWAVFVFSPLSDKSPLQGLWLPAGNPESAFIKSRTRRG